VGRQRHLCVRRHRPHGPTQRHDRLRRGGRRGVVRRRPDPAVCDVSPFGLDQDGEREDRCRAGPARTRRPLEPAQHPVGRHQGRRRHGRLDQGRDRLRDGRRGRRPGQLPLRRLGNGHRKGVVRRHPIGDPLDERLETEHRHRRGAHRRAHLEVHLRPVHRAPRPVHLRRHLGRDARRPQVLLRRRRQGIALAAARRLRRHRHGQGRLLRRRPHAPHRRARRHRAGGPRPRQGQDVRRPHLAQGHRRRRPRRGQPRLGRGREGPPDRPHRQTHRRLRQDAPGVQRRRDDG